MSAAARRGLLEKRAWCGYHRDMGTNYILFSALKKEKKDVHVPLVAQFEVCQGLKFSICLYFTA
jgi:hypothetical protein